MKYLIISFTFIFICNLSIAKDFIIDVYGKEKVKVKVYKTDENNFLRIYTSNGVFKTNNNITAIRNTIMLRKFIIKKPYSI